MAEHLRSIWGLWLMAIFLGIIWWAFRPGNRARLERHASIPLHDDE